MGSSQELKYVGFVTLIEVKFLAIFSNIYGFFRDNSRCLKESVASVEAKVLSVMEPVTNMINTVCEYKLGFIDEKLDRYAPTFIKNLVSSLNSYIEEKISSVEEVFGPLVQKAKTIVENGLSSIESTLQKFIDAEKSVFKDLVDRAEGVLEKGLDFTKQALDKAKGVVGDIPIIGDATQSFITVHIDMVSQLIETTTSSIKENGIFGAISSVVEHVVKESQESSASIIQKGSETISQALDTTKTIVGGIPIIGDTAQSIITKQTDMASQLIESTTSSIVENGIFGTISSITENVVKDAQETGASIIQKGSESVSQALDTAKSVVGGIPIIGEATESIITKQTDMASQLIETTTSSIKENGIFGTIASAAENVINGAQETSSSIIQKGSDVASQALDTTTSLVGGIPIIGDAAQSVITKQTDMASQAIETTTSSIKENGIFGAIASAAESVINGAQETSSSIIQKGSDIASQALDTTTSLVGGIPIIGDAAQSVLSKQTDTASQAIETTTSSIKENGIFGAIASAAENVIKGAQETSSSIIQKGSETASQALDTTTSLVGGIPIIGDTAQSIITKQTDIASQLISSTTSSYKENGIVGALTSAADQVVKEAQAAGESIIQKTSDSANQALETTKSVVGSIPIVGKAAESIITTQADKATEVVEKSTESVKKHGLFGSLISAVGNVVENVVEDVGETTRAVIEKGAESVNKTLEKANSTKKKLFIF